MAATTIPYNWQSKPQWGEDGFNQSQAVQGEVAPYSQDFNHGYDSKVGRLSLAKRTQALQKANGILCDNVYYFPMFIQDLTIDFSISGSTAQSQLTRDFYPHHMTLPGFTLSGQSYDQTSYGMLCEFVHAAQRRPFTQGTYPLIQLYIQGNVYPKATGTRNSSLAVTFKPPGSQVQSAKTQIIKGQHKEILCLGYIMSMPRQHETGVYAPEWDMNFMVSTMLSGPYTENLAQTTVEQSNWTAILKGTNATKWGTATDLKQNKKDLAWAAANSSNVISTSS